MVVSLSVACIKPYDTSAPPSGKVGDEYFALCVEKEQRLRDQANIRATATWDEYRDSADLHSRLNDNEHKLSSAIITLWDNCYYQEQKNRQWAM